MKIIKLFPLVAIVAVCFLLIGQPVLQAGDTLEDWPITTRVKGDRSFGTLTVYYEVIGSGCGNFNDTKVRIFLFLRLYEKKTKTWHIVSSVYGSTEEPFCLPSGIDSGAHQDALSDFLTNAVLPRLDQTRGYTSIYLSDVDNDYNNYNTLDGGPICVVADIELTAN